jgi:hypothetical protein
MAFLLSKGVKMSQYKERANQKALFAAFENPLLPVKSSILRSEQWRI